MDVGRVPVHQADHQARYPVRNCYWQQWRMAAPVCRTSGILQQQKDVVAKQCRRDKHEPPTRRQNGPVCVHRCRSYRSVSSGWRGTSGLFVRTGNTTVAVSEVYSEVQPGYTIQLPHLMLKWYVSPIARSGGKPACHNTTLSSPVEDRCGRIFQRETEPDVKSSKGSVDRPTGASGTIHCHDIIIVASRRPASKTVSAPNATPTLLTCELECRRHPPVMNGFSVSALISSGCRSAMVSPASRFWMNMTVLTKIVLSETFTPQTRHQRCPRPTV